MCKTNIENGAKAKSSCLDFIHSNRNNYNSAQKQAVFTSYITKGIASAHDISLSSYSLVTIYLLYTCQINKID